MQFKFPLTADSVCWNVISLITRQIVERFSHSPRFTENDVAAGKERNVESWLFITAIIADTRMEACPKNKKLCIANWVHVTSQVDIKDDKRPTVWSRRRKSQLTNYAANDTFPALARKFLFSVLARGLCESPENLLSLKMKDLNDLKHKLLETFSSLARCSFLPQVIAESSINSSRGIERFSFDINRRLSELASLWDFIQCERALVASFLFLDRFTNKAKRVESFERWWTQTRRKRTKATRRVKYFRMLS